MILGLQRQIVKSLSTCTRQLSSNPQICIVGSGPAGFYTASHILKGHPQAQVDIYEKLPIPFGLVRYGVAPDHPNDKNCINSFTEYAKKENVSFIGNVSVGKDVSLDQLRDAYHAVVLCYGSEQDKCLNIPGENLPNVIPARNFVGWYNGFPEDANLEIDLGVEEAVVIGQGNVAIDVARMLLRSVDDLKKTDIPEPVLEKLTKSKVKRVTLVGRRRAQDAPFTIREVREMIKYKGLRPVFRKQDMEPLKDLALSAEVGRKRLWNLLHKTSLEPTSAQLEDWQEALKEWRLRFLLSPREVLSNGSKTGIIGIKCAVNRMENNKAVPTDEIEVLDCGLVLRSIGYKGVPIDSSLPFNAQRGAIPNEYGMVKELKGIYVSGWIATGPEGVLVATLNNARSTTKTLLNDMKEGRISLHEKEGKKKIMQLLEQNKVRPTSFDDWEVINKHEVERGQALDKPREKVTNIEEMFEIAQKGQTL